MSNVVINEAEQTDLLVFPNPFKDRFYISMEDILDHHPDIIICDLSGREVNAEIKIWSDKLISAEIIHPKGKAFVVKIIDGDKEYSCIVYR